MSEGSLRKPRLALTLALAGKRNVALEARAGLEAGLALVFRSIGERLDVLHAEAASGEDTLVLRFCTEEPARLTLITGLADGADQIGGALFLAPDAEVRTVERLMGALLPCARMDFVANSRVEDTAGFERLAASCAFVIELDKGPAVIADELLVATGRLPRSMDLGFENIGLEPNTWLDVDDTMLVKGFDWLYATGDINHRVLLTHQGKYQARAAGDDPDAVPGPR